jgi:hypothetical protein
VLWFYGLVHLEEEHEEVEDHAADHMHSSKRSKVFLRSQVDEDEI